MSLWLQMKLYSVKPLVLALQISHVLDPSEYPCERKTKWGYDKSIDKHFTIGVH